ncbi:hypothetical protein ABW20_dc0103982 [Dactylellina cionopaga]|nr:hypothetical protein ABW20_dc0103982 [Dactylellina cionopaga]
MYSTVLIVGAGESGICMGIQLKAQLNIHDFVIYERHGDIGGTWHANTYPGPELHAYFTKICDDYKIRPHITFNTEVESATWVEERQVWSVRLRKRAVADWELKLGEERTKKITVSGQVGDTWTHECKVFFTAVGGLVEPNEINLKGMEDFKGSIFHSAFWDHAVDIEGKDVVLIGNGCSACQIVPAIEPQVKSLTQIVRSSHWMLPRPKFPGVDPDMYKKWSPTIFRYFPGSQTVARAIGFLGIELGWLPFRNDALGEKLRVAQEKRSIQHVKANAPEKYWDLLVPKFPIGFKRRIFDDIYLPSLKSPKILLTNDDVTHVSENAIHTASGAEYKADVIVMATGYKTNEWVAPLEIIGRKGEHLSDHWKEIGGPTAYNGTAMSGFPNCFLIVGPNTVTGHSSVILATENMVNYALKLAAPVLKGDASEVEVKKEAEVKYSKWIQDSMKKTVFNNRQFRSWYVREDGWNSTTYPHSQVHFTYRAYFPIYKDWILKKTKQGVLKTRIRKFLLFFLFFGMGVSHMLLRRKGMTFKDVANLSATFLVSSLDNFTELMKSKLQ